MEMGLFHVMLSFEGRKGDHLTDARGTQREADLDVGIRPKALLPFSLCGYGHNDNPDVEKISLDDGDHNTELPCKI